MAAVAESQLCLGDREGAGRAAGAAAALVEGGREMAGSSRRADYMPVVDGRTFL